MVRHFNRAGPMTNSHEVFSDPPTRDLVGYGGAPPRVRWPNGARVAVSLVVNLETGAENNVLHGDAASEHLLCEVDATPVVGGRDLNAESVYEYESRAGLWRILRCLASRDAAFSVQAVGMAVEKTPDIARAMADMGADFQGHGWRWIDYADVPEAVERDHIARTVAAIEAVTGARPNGWYTGRQSLNTRRLVVEEGGFLFDSDDYSDDLPFWSHDFGRPHLVLPHAIDTNDSRFLRMSGFVTADDFLAYHRAAFDTLHEEGGKMLTIGLHGRLIGRPGRIRALKELLDHMRARGDVWIARRGDIARHWATHHPA
jgi:peptidoglycan/xylan/chitin deacetylase (PgdA/CDA1 family)